MMKNKIFPVLGTVLLVGGLTLINKNNKDIAPAHAEELSIASEGDAFVLLPNHFDADQSFVYTADLHFRSGQAGALCFGSEENDHYYVVNMDRFENHIKFLHFQNNGVGGYNVDELYVDWFIGNNKMTGEEEFMVKREVVNIENVNLKVILTVEEAENPSDDDHVYMEFYVEGIKRFGVDTTIDLNYLGKPYKYEGGYLGMNCFNADVYLENIEIGKSDYSYFSEPYRNQYHLQPFAKWSNDPNALVYHNGWYHVFYQTHPFGLYWGSMYWGHARSRDLIHFEFLPICLFPDRRVIAPYEYEEAYMWSGCAISYTKGMSAAVDGENWFDNSDGDGILGIFTRDGGLAQDQVIITSDDDGLTWTKRYTISQHITGHENKIDWRDPKVFPLVKDGSGKVTMWGMTLSSYALNKGWFLKSPNLVSWSLAGDYALPTPECIGVGVVKDDNGDEHAYLTNKSRTYILGSISYDEMTGKVVFLDEDNVDISTYSLDQMVARLKPLDFGPDSYASQSFYINDPSSEFNGKDIVLNWFSGDLNASFCTGPGEYAGLRGRWNGGFTTPVEYGVKVTDEGLRLSQKPITVNNTNLEKTNIVTSNEEDINVESENPLKDVHTHIFELDASIDIKNNSSITFKVDVGDDEYMELGWNEVDGYYVDRTYLDDKGINTNIDWHVKYASHILGDSDTKTFYVLSDNGGLEVFCEDYSIPFYFVTTASMYSTRASLRADDAHINYLRLNEVHSAYRKNVDPDEGVLYVSTDDVQLDTQISQSKFVTCWFSGEKDLSWEVIENDDVVSATYNNEGLNVTAIKAGSASFKVSVGEQERIINVTVHNAYFHSDFTFEKEGVVSGNWLVNNDVLTGEKANGNAFFLAEESGSDFTYTGKFDITSGTAGALVFRAATNMTSYLVANYDMNDGVVKLWSTHGELARSGILNLDRNNIVLTVKAVGREINITANGIYAITYTLLDNEPLSGKFGLNAFSASVDFKVLSLMKENYDYVSGDLAIDLQMDQYVSAVYNITKGNLKLEPGFYYQSGKTLFIRDSYFALLENGTYKFKVVASTSFYVNVEVNASHTFVINDLEVEKGVNVNVYVGNNPINSVKVNGTAIGLDKYLVKDYTLTIDASCFQEGDNTVLVNDAVSFNVKVVNREETTKIKGKTNYLPLILGLSIGGGVLLIGGAVAVILIVKHKKGKKSV